MTPRPSDIRHRVDPGDVPPEKAARRLHLTPERFAELLPKLLARGFPEADQDTGMYDLDAIDLWRKSRHGTSAGLTVVGPGHQPVPTIHLGALGDRFAAKKRSRHG